jgi:hypothetical protein
VTPRRRAQLMEAAAIAAPLVLLGMTRVMTTPAAAVGAPQKPGAAATAPISSATGKVRPEVQKASEYVRSIDLAAPLASPLDQPAPAAPAAPPLSAEPERAVATHDSTPKATDEAPARRILGPLTGLRLSATLRTRDGGGLAAVNGRIYRVGEDIVPGVRLLSINTDTNRVQVALGDGETAELGREP